MFLDNFNRADELLEVSPNWTRVGGSAGAARVIGNELHQTPGQNTAYQCPDQGNSDHYTEMVSRDSSIGSFNGFSACNRLTDANNFVGVRHNGGALQIYTRISGSFVLLASNGISLNVNDVLRFESEGSVHRIYVNSVLIITTTNSFNIAETRQGLVARTNGGAWIDDFEAGSLGVVDVAPPMTGSQATGSAGGLSASTSVSATAQIPGVQSGANAGVVSAALQSSVAIQIDGVQSISSAGDISAAAGSRADLSGVSSNTDAGDISVFAGGQSSVTVAGIEAPANAGEIQADAQAEASAAVTGIQSLGAPGDIVAGSTTSTTVTIDGLSAVGTVGSITVDAGTTVVILGGASGAGAGDITVGGDLSLTVTGVVSQAGAGTVLVPTTLGMVYIDGIITITPALSGDISIN